MRNTPGEKKRFKRDSNRKPFLPLKSDTLQTLQCNVATKLNNWTGHKRYRVLDINAKKKTKDGVETEEANEHSALWGSICDFYGIPRSPFSSDAVVPVVGVPEASIDTAHAASAKLPYFYQLVPTAFMNPDGAGQVKRIQLLTPLAADWATRVRPYKGPSVELVLGGTRAFELYDGTYLSNAACRWRVVSEAAAIVARVADGRRKMVVDLDAAPAGGAVRAFLKDLFVNGFVFLQQQQVETAAAPAIADGDNATTPTTTVTSVTFDPSVEALLAPFRRRAAEGSDDHDGWLVGGVLIGLRGGLAEFEKGEEGQQKAAAGAIASSSKEDADDKTWWLSATVSGKKLELSVDVSNRALALTAYFGLLDPFQGGKSVASIPADEQ